MKSVVIHSDGGCRGNPGPGGWAATLAYGTATREISGGVPATTNNRMELQAAIEALRLLKEPCAVEFHTDSEYLKDGITSWIAGWRRNGWRTSAKKPVKNADLWRELDTLVQGHAIAWKWVKGHAGHAGNERCDELANVEIAKIKAAHGPDALKAFLAEFQERQKEPPADAPKELF